MNNGTCSEGEPCPKNSVKKSDGTCDCLTGFTLFEDKYCERCAAGQLWSSQSNKCIVVCGTNAGYSEATRQCVCNPGFGIYEGQCQVCPNKYFTSQGYCVTCPKLSTYSPLTKRCDCDAGYLISP